MIEIRTDSVEETVDIGTKLGSLLEKGDIICLSGNLGTGKTAFTNGIAAALGIEGYITSPTFTIVNEYKGRLPLYHFDVYRIADPEEMFEIGFEEYTDGNGVVVIEWPEQIQDILPAERIWVEIKKDLAAGVDTRIITIEFKGKKYSEYEKHWKG
ncbi:MAG: tRNA (adenosine(37)-N6)-threonylcarbamoyltransferase complex ATPase subunit type 1 TsaE [Clostridia bacterium]|nr:tRNA (adenosine(37)-N6)-threonylcarbamoyltransferase complex ATPase subunit type 1 TsaE [Clostridia bacterium]